MYLYLKRVFLCKNNAGVLFCWVTVVRAPNHAAYKLNCEISYHASSKTLITWVMKTLQNNLKVPTNCLNLMKHYRHLDRAADPRYSELASVKCVMRTVKNPAKKKTQGQTKFWKRNQESPLLANIPKRHSLKIEYAEIVFELEFLKMKAIA